ncbi:hypothetical protein [Algoriphagus sp.]|uniref:hypothetical protein n=1 Tax=Algoriphagus sp. TaxID=1872435 RepID=UPI00261330E7|nr:hypothetical protein [Algoriphagus sp.]
MSTSYPNLQQLIVDMAEGDEEFKDELTQAIHHGLIELKEVYEQGVRFRDEVTIQQIRHKVKPTLGMFEFDDLTEILQEGKEILESRGFGEEFESHWAKLNLQVSQAIELVAKLI